MMWIFQDFIVFGSGYVWRGQPLTCILSECRTVWKQSWRRNLSGFFHLISFTHEPESHACKGADEWLSVQGSAPPIERNPVKREATAVRRWSFTPRRRQCHDRRICTLNLRYCFPARNTPPVL